MRGGARQGAGRKTKAEELKVVNQATEAITEQYGSLKEGFKALLNSGEASLIKWVFEHAAGKPTDFVEVDGEISHELTFKVIRANKDRDSSQ